MSQLSCLIGHLPVSDFSGHFDSFNVFTILRDPIERVISFYEFLHHASVEQLEALSLAPGRSEEHTSELQSLMRISYAVFCLKKKNKKYSIIKHTHRLLRNNK